MAALGNYLLFIYLFIYLFTEISNYFKGSSYVPNLLKDNF